MNNVNALWKSVTFEIYTLFYETALRIKQRKNSPLRQWAFKPTIQTAFNSNTFAERGSDKTGTKKLVQKRTASDSRQVIGLICTSEPHIK